MSMNEGWKNWDLKLREEKKHIGEVGTTIEEWTRHIIELKENEEIKWTTYNGYYRTPYSGTLKFIFLEGGDNVRLRTEGDTEQKIVLGNTFEWISDWYEADGWCHQLTLRLTERHYRVSELPDGVRTMQQTDHDAWEYAVRNGLI